MDKLTAGLTALSTTVDGVVADMGRVGTDMAALKTEITTLQGQANPDFTNALSMITSIQNKLSTAQTTLDAVDVPTPPASS